MALTRIKSDQIQDQAVTTEKLADNSVTDNKLDNDPIDYGLITEEPEE